MEDKNLESGQSLITQINDELKRNPDFSEMLIEFLTVALKRSPSPIKNKIFRLIKKYVPVEWLMALETIAVNRDD